MIARQLKRVRVTVWCRLKAQWLSVVWLTVIWVLLWGEATIANALGGIVISAIVLTAFPMPIVRVGATVRLWPLCVLIGRFVFDIVVASAEVAWLALRMGRKPRGAVIGVQLRNRNDAFLTTTAEMSSLVPGTLVIEVHRLTGMIYVHVLDVDLAGGIDKVRADTLALEARVLRAFARDAPALDLARNPNPGPRADLGPNRRVSTDSEEPGSGRDEEKP